MIIIHFVYPLLKGTPNEGAAGLRAEAPSASAACSPAAGQEHVALSIYL